MSHFLAFVLIPLHVENISAKVAELIAPYYLWREVEPYRRYFPNETVKMWADKFEAGTNLLLILEQLRSSSRWSDAGLDERGLYHTSTFNPRGMWDNWCYSGGKYMLGELIWKDCLSHNNAQVGREEPWNCNSCLVKKLSADVYPAAIITPDGNWHDLLDFSWKLVEHDSPDNQIAKQKWQARARELLQKYADCLAVGIDCHG